MITACVLRGVAATARRAHTPSTRPVTLRRGDGVSRTPRRTDDVRVVRLHVTSVNERVGLLLKGRHELVLEVAVELGALAGLRSVTESVESVDVMTLRRLRVSRPSIQDRAVEL